MKPDRKRPGTERRCILALIWGVALLLTLPACGKKGPPVAPRQMPPPAVEKLSRHRAGDRLVLTWTLPAASGLQRTDLAGFRVYRSRVGRAEPDCRSCPVLFERIADIPMERSAAGSGGTPRFSFSDTPAEGYRYRYKVTIYTPAGHEGQASDTVDAIY